MREFWKIVSLRSKIALTLSLIAFIAAIVGSFTLKSEMRIVTWGCVIVAWIINYSIILEENLKLRKEQHIKNYEIDSLKWSYRTMGRYIEHHKTNLDDIDVRIENELRDIEIRKKHLYGD